ncbi:Schizosaccharomyces pombe specific protein [Schizosaccharomyces pombe]|uniref:Uncharacterized protein C1687.23c n=1 Tax=Schizosaccharomyces pombe (strain 972 / ATCC 24843) TaxID=284812 RepID=YFFN_SCHPO|nr:uncharacterized protein SPAC1687.23c [Schizosaccharomyces pombe]Q9C118.1 RecName: Full=Uncharacterized protein C1687.23c [Schizosaccharomyces pombe 972h-]CAC34405.1 sequence orphan [Schizosaccharomyces pombe]|eukprot:NP_593133.1 uncharacterized protein SPAC1687.23c [Schizosaccharomyces pombe]
MWILEKKNIFFKIIHIKSSRKFDFSNAIRIVLLPFSSNCCRNSYTVNNGTFTGRQIYTSICKSRIPPCLKGKNGKTTKSESEPMSQKHLKYVKKYINKVRILKK